MVLNVTWEPYPYPTNLTGGMANITSYINSTTGGMFGYGILVPLFVILFLSFRRWGDTEAFAASSFITMAVCGILRALSLVPDLAFVILIMMTGISLVLMWRRTV
jgi:hypothetical protein